MDSRIEEFNSLRITPLEDEEEEQEEIETDEDEDEDEEEAEFLGFVEKPKNPCFILRQLFPSKAGGVPAWLDPVDLPSEKSRACGICGDPLQFLLQIYAPIPEEDSKLTSTFHRILFVFMCPSMSCLLRDQHEQWKRREENPSRSVKVFRCQLPRCNPFYSSDPPKGDGTDKPSNAGATLCSWCGTWKGDKVCSSCRKARYCSGKHQAAHWRSGHKTDCHHITDSSEVSVINFGRVNAKTLSGDKAACRALWPEYEILTGEESASNTEMPEDNNYGTSLVPKHDGTDEVFKSLSDNFEADDNKKSWASFEERISKAPGQVLRYRRGMKSKPLWPLSIGRPSKADIPKCNHCKGPLCYEFQVMPQLLYYFNVRNDPDSLDWATIIVYTCSASCEASATYKEEFVWVQLYPSAAMP